MALQLNSGGIPVRFRSNSDGIPGKFRGFLVVFQWNSGGITAQFCQKYPEFRRTAGHNLRQFWVLQAEIPAVFRSFSDGIPVVFQ